MFYNGGGSPIPIFIALPKNRGAVRQISVRTKASVFVFFLTKSTANRPDFNRFIA